MSEREIEQVTRSCGTFAMILSKPDRLLTRPLLTFGMARSLKYNRERHSAARERKPFACDHVGCKKLCRTAGGLSQHKRDKHS